MHDCVLLCVKCLNSIRYIISSTCANRKYYQGGHQVDSSDYFAIPQQTYYCTLADIRIISDVVIKRIYNSRIEMIISNAQTSTLWLCWDQMIIARYREFLGEGIW